MSPRILTPQSIRAASTAFRRCNSNIASRRSATRVIEMVAARPTAREQAVPFLWLLSGGLAVHTFSRIEGTSEQQRDLEKLLIV
ncbi:hypothetical protein BU16DRAFT_612060 [Lophium mytilinum]|uniref:Uncharacterized protein n=1 Tax=Lophium mytilinum TaxID=390894 RepID=A0A6A6RC08_9PEZI|nr:hypothetical protein BU16DRAFT_612060 [Lophium mytilinum]